MAEEMSQTTSEMLDGMNKVVGQMMDASKEIQLLESPDIERYNAEHIQSVMVDSWYQGGERYWLIDPKPSPDGWVGTRHYDD